MRRSRGITPPDSKLKQTNPASLPRSTDLILPEQPCGDCDFLPVLTRIAEALDRLVATLGEQEKPVGGGDRTRYTRPSESSDLVDEKTMATALSISNRTLAKHRRDGRLPGCWVRNGGRIFWRVAETREAWERGIA